MKDFFLIFPFRSLKKNPAISSSARYNSISCSQTIWIVCNRMHSTTSGVQTTYSILVSSTIRHLIILSSCHCLVLDSCFHIVVIGCTANGLSFCLLNTWHGINVSLSLILWLSQKTRLKKKQFYLRVVCYSYILFLHLVWTKCRLVMGRVYFFLDGKTFVLIY